MGSCGDYYGAMGALLDTRLGWIHTFQELAQTQSLEQGQYLVWWLLEQSGFFQSWNQLLGPRSLWDHDPEHVAENLYRMQYAFIETAVHLTTEFIKDFADQIEWLMSEYSKTQKVEDLSALIKHVMSATKFPARRLEIITSAWEDAFGEPYDRNNSLPGFSHVAAACIHNYLFSGRGKNLVNNPRLEWYAVGFVEKIAASLQSTGVALNLFERNEVCFFLIDLVWHDMGNIVGRVTARLPLFSQLSPEKQASTLEHLRSQVVPFLRNMQLSLGSSSRLAKLRNSENGFETLKQIQIAAVAENIVELLEDAAEEKNMQIVVDLSRLPQNGYSFLLHESDIFTALLNLLSNAVKHGSSDSTIVLRIYVEHQPSQDTTEVTRQLVFKVTNQADLLTPDQLESFFKLKTGIGGSGRVDRDKMVTGLGLGTQVIKFVADQYQGEVGATQTDGGELTTWFSVSVVATREFFAAKVVKT